MPQLAPADTSPPGFELRRDATGRIVQRTQLFSTPPETRRYAYDSAGRLARVTDERGALCESYQYDQQSRRLADICPQSSLPDRPSGLF